jgi:ferritin-like metal-binding protein YciE
MQLDQLGRFARRGGGLVLGQEHVLAGRFNAAGAGEPMYNDTRESDASMTSLDEQVTKYLTDAHSIEQQALVQMKLAPKIAGDPEIAAAFDEHLTETEDHETLVREQLEARDASPSAIKDVAGRVTGGGFALFAKFNPDTPGKLVTHAYSYEHMEFAAYDLLGRISERAQDADTAALARRILAEERAMAERLSLLFDRAVDASLRDQDPDDLGGQLDSYLTDAHAIEAQAIELLSKGADIAGQDDLSSVFREHLEETHEHQRLIDERLQARDASSSKIKDAALRLGALNWGGFFGAQPDTPAKLAGFAYAFEHLEIAAYELLLRVAQRVSDSETEAVAERILNEERTAADKLYGLFDAAVDAALRDQEVTAS